MTRLEKLQKLETLLKTMEPQLLECGFYVDFSRLQELMEEEKRNTLNLRLGVLVEENS